MNIISSNNLCRTLDNIAEYLKQHLQEISRLLKQDLSSEKLASELRDNCWVNGGFLPWIIWTKKLPSTIGTSTITCSNCEIDALNRAEELLPIDLPRLTILDSSHIRGIAKKLRDDMNEITTRQLIRHILVSAGNGATNRRMMNIQEATHLNYSTYEVLVQNMSTIIQLMRTWINHKGCRHSSKYWPEPYFDNNTLRCYVEVNSHQLNDNFQKKRPNLFTDFIIYLFFIFLIGNIFINIILRKRNFTTLLFLSYLHILLLQ